MNFLDSAFSAFFVLMGLPFFLTPLAFVLYKLAFRIGSKKAQAKVLRIERNRDPDTGSIMIQPVFEFWTADGQRMEARTGVRYGLRYMPVVGTYVKLYYRPGTEPLKLDVASRGLWEVSAVLMLTGLLLLAPAIFHFFLL